MRRHPYGVLRAGSEEEFLRALRSRYPALAGETDLLLEAVARPLAPAELPRVGAAVERIEQSLRT